MTREKFFRVATIVLAVLVAALVISGMLLSN